MDSSKITVGIIGGTGLDQDSSIFTDVGSITIGKTPYGYPSDTELLTGKIHGVSVIVMGRHGKNHDVNPSNVNYRANLWALQTVGCQIVLVTTACGSLKEEIYPGSFAILDQYIDMTKGKREYSFYKVSHIPQAKPFNQCLQNFLAQSLQELGFNYKTKCTAVSIEGPRFSTVAESNIYRSWGCDIVNMTAVPEAQLASELGLIYGSLGLVTDYDVWHSNEEESVSVELVTARLKELSTKARKVLIDTIKKISNHDWTNEINQKKEMAKSAIMHE